MKTTILSIGVFLMLATGFDTALYAATDTASLKHTENKEKNGNNYQHLQGPSTGDLHLRSYRGPFSIRSLRGNVVVMFFGYTHCPDVCPRDMSIISHAYDSFNASQQSRLKVVFVSLDPARDDVKTLKDFAQYFNPDFIGVTGSKKDINTLARRFNVHFKKVPVKGSSSEYGFEHTASIYILDSQGRISVILPNGISDIALRQAIKYLLDELKS